MKIRFAEKSDIEILSTYDKHIRITELESSVSLGRVIAAENNGTLLGWLRWNLFWDNTPFCTMLFIDRRYQGRGYGRRLMEYWEKDMSSQGYGMVLTSTQVDEAAQHFYRKMGYKDCGGFIVDVPGYEQPMELFMIKAV